MDFQVKEVSLSFCPHCGLPVRSGGRSATARFCSSSCRTANDIFGGGKTANTELRAVRIAVGAGGILSIFMCRLLIFMQVADAEAVDALLLAQALMFLPAFWAFGAPQVGGFGEESSGLRHGAAVAIAALATWGFSSYRLIHDLPLTYFDLSAMVLALSALAALVEAASRADGVRALGNLLDSPPDLATVIRGEGTAQVRVTELKPGDRLRVEPGEILPADGTLVEGKAVLSTLRTNGSAEPLLGKPGLQLSSGQVNLGDSIILEVTVNGPDGWWRQMHKGVMGLLLQREEIEAGPAGLFGGGAFLGTLLAAGTFALSFSNGFDDAWLRAFSVLILASPGPFAAAADRGLAVTLSSLNRLGVEVRTLKGLWDLSEAPVGFGGLGGVGGMASIPIPTKGVGYRIHADGAMRDIVWARAVRLCRDFRYNVDSNAWILLLWTLVGLGFSVGGLFSPPMAASFSLFGAMLAVHRAPRPSGTIA